MEESLETQLSRHASEFLIMSATLDLLQMGSVSLANGFKEQNYKLRDEELFGLAGVLHYHEKKKSEAKEKVSEIYELVYGELLPENDDLALEMLYHKISINFDREFTEEILKRYGLK